MPSRHRGATEDLGEPETIHTFSISREDGTLTPACSGVKGTHGNSLSNSYHLPRACVGPALFSSHTLRQ